MQGRPPSRPAPPQEPRDFDPRQLDAPHSHPQLHQAAKPPQDQRRPSQESSKSRQYDPRQPAASASQGPRDRRSRQIGDDEAAFGAQGDAWATSEEESESARASSTAAQSSEPDSYRTVTERSAPPLRLVFPQPGKFKAARNPLLAWHDADEQN